MSSRLDDILAHFERTSDQFFSKDEFAAKIKSGKKLRIKYGVDVTAPTLHIGHAVNLWLMRYMQNLGHQVVFLIGDFTTRIGDPDGRLDTRPVISREDIEKNAQAFIEQAKMVLRFDDPELLEVRRNSEWLDKMQLQDFLGLLGQVTHARLISRDMFQKRIAENREIYMHEMLYPVLQGWDSVAVESDVTIIGSDQLFNEMMGRFFQERHGQKPQSIITTKITPGTDGKAKQSKSLGNYIGLAHSPRDKFGRVMSIPDRLIEDYFRVYTDVPLDEIDRMKPEIARHPRMMKAKLAYAIVGRYHGHDVAVKEQAWFDKTFSKRSIPTDIPVLTVYNARTTLLDLVVLAHPKQSKSHARRLITQGAVELNEQKFTVPEAEMLVKTDDILQIGKREWYKLQLVDLHEFKTENLWMRPLAVEDLDLVRNTLPQWEIVKYLGGMPASRKEAESVAREVFKKVIYKPEPKDEWLWKISPAGQPGKIIGVAHLRRDGAKGHENIWLAPEYQSATTVEEALDAINEHAFANLGFSRVMYKKAFAFAAAPQEIETLQRRFMNMDAAARNRDDPAGMWGFTKEGWLMMKEQMAKNAPATGLMSAPPKARERKQKVYKEKTDKLKSGFAKTGLLTAEESARAKVLPRHADALRVEKDMAEKLRLHKLSVEGQEQDMRRHAEKERAARDVQDRTRFARQKAEQERAATADPAKKPAPPKPGAT